VQLAGFASANAAFVLSNNGLGIAGDVGVPIGMQTLTVHFTGVGYIHPDGQFNLTGNASATFAGFVMPNAAFVLNNNGLTAQGTVSAQIGTGSVNIVFAGWIHTDGQFNVTGTAQASFSGFVIPTAAFVLNNDGLAVAGDATIQLGSVNVPVHFVAVGYIQTNGQFTLDGHASANFDGWVMANADFVLTDTGLTAQGTAAAQIGTGSVNVLFAGWVHTDGQFNVTGTAQATFSGFAMPSAAFVLTNTGLTAQGTITAQIGTGSVNILFAGWIHTDGQFNVTGTAQATFSGFAIPNAAFVLNNSGLAVAGDATIRLGSVNVPVHFVAVGYINPNGQFNLDGRTQATFSGFVSANADFMLNNSGLTAAGNVDFHLGSLGYSVPFTGWVHTDGQFQLTATVAQLNFAGFIGAGLTLTLNNAGLGAQGSFQLGSVVNASLTGTIYTNNTFSLTGSANVSFVGFNANASFTLTTGGVAIAAGVSVPYVATVNMNGSIQTNGQFTLNFSGTFGINGFGGGGWLRLDNSGVTAHLDVGFGILGVAAHMDGYIHSNGQFQLTAAANMSLGPISGNLSFTLNNSGFSTHAHGQIDLRTTIYGPWGLHLDVGFLVAVDVSFAVQTNGTFNASGDFTATAYLGVSLSVGIGFSLDNHTFTVRTSEIGFDVWFISFHPFGDVVVHY
jgi:hypothetical protein